MKFQFLFFIIIGITSLAFSQKKDEGKVKIILVNSDKINFYEDTCFMYVYLEDSMIKKINLSRILFPKKENDRPTIDLWIKNGNYSALIINMFSYPIIITNVKVKKKAICYFPIDYNELKETSNSQQKVLIKEYNKLLKKYFKE